MATTLQRICYASASDAAYLYQPGWLLRGLDCRLILSIQCKRSVIGLRELNCSMLLVGPGRTSRIVNIESMPNRYFSITNARQSPLGLHHDKDCVCAPTSFMDLFCVISAHLHSWPFDLADSAQLRIKAWISCNGNWLWTTTSSCPTLTAARM